MTLYNSMTQEQRDASEVFHDKFKNCEGWEQLTSGEKIKSDCRSETPKRVDFDFVYVTVGDQRIFADIDIDSLLFTMGISDNNDMVQAVMHGYKPLTLTLWVEA